MDFDGDGDDDGADILGGLFEIIAESAPWQVALTVLVIVLIICLVVYFAQS